MESPTKYQRESLLAVDPFEDRGGGNNHDVNHSLTTNHQQQLLSKCLNENDGNNQKTKSINRLQSLPNKSSFNDDYSMTSSSDCCCCRRCCCSSSSYCFNNCSLKYSTLSSSSSISSSLTALSSKNDSCSLLTKLYLTHSCLRSTRRCLSNKRSTPKSILYNNNNSSNITSSILSSLLLLLMSVNPVQQEHYKNNHYHYYYHGKRSLKLLIIALLLLLSSILTFNVNNCSVYALKSDDNRRLSTQANIGNIASNSDSNGDEDLIKYNQLELIFSVTENVPVGTFIGVIRSPNDSVQIEPPFLIVPIPGGDIMQMRLPTTNTNTNDQPTFDLSSSTATVNNPHRSSATGSVDTDLNIDQSTGEIRTAVELDHEHRLYYSFIAISLTGVNVHVRIVSKKKKIIIDIFHSGRESATGVQPFK